MIVLDTNVLSELVKAEVNQTVVAWIDQRAPRDLYTTSIAVAEMLYSIMRLPAGKRKHGLLLQTRQMIEDDFANRVLVFDTEAAEHYADLVASRERSGKSISTEDAQIAAICRSHGATLATRNIKDFVQIELEVVNPWNAA